MTLVIDKVGVGVGDFLVSVIRVSFPSFEDFQESNKIIVMIIGLNSS